MSANVETMFYVRETPWHGLGTKVMSALDSEEALIAAGLNWNVIQEPIYTTENEPIKGYKANVRDSDRRVLGVVTDRYKVVQNHEAFSFTDELLGQGVRYETAGSLQEGRKVWLLAHMPHEYIISGERISPYLLFSNSHDGSGAIKVALTPIRVVCNNTLNLALRTAERSWSMIHTGVTILALQYPDSGKLSTDVPDVDTGIDWLVYLAQYSQQCQAQSRFGVRSRLDIVENTEIMAGPNQSFYCGTL